jgi:hypothetical protein
MLKQSSNNPQTLPELLPGRSQRPSGSKKFSSEAGRCLWGQLPGNPTLLHAALPETRSAGIRGVLGIQVCGILWPWLEISTVPLSTIFVHFWANIFHHKWQWVFS